VTSFSNKQQKPPNNENSTKKLLEQSNSLIDVKSQQKYAQMENSTIYQDNTNGPPIGGDKKFF
jgi:hypothetical protein